MNILITGSAGFIGYHLAVRCLSLGWEVTGLDSFNDYYPVHVKNMRNRELMTHKNFTSVSMDVSDSDKIIPFIANGNFESVCHLAAQAGVRYSLIAPLSYASSNLTGFTNILEGVRQSPVKPRLVYASSSSVYGGTTTLPFVESAEVNTPVSFYAATKKANELMAHSYSHLYQMETTGLRFFTVYGESCRPDMMLWKFTDAIFYGDTIHLYNKGEQKRSFTYVGDIVNGIEKALVLPKNESYEIFNLGNDQCEELGNVVSILEEAIGKKALVVMAPAQPGDMTATWADIEKARSVLGFNPETSFKECVELFVRWYIENPRTADIVHKWLSNTSA